MKYDCKDQRKSYWIIRKDTHTSSVFTGMCTHLALKCHQKKWSRQYFFQNLNEKFKKLVTLATRYMITLLLNITVQWFLIILSFFPGQRP